MEEVCRTRDGQKHWTEFIHQKKGYCITNSCGFGLGLVDSFSYTKDDEARVRNTSVTSGKVSFNHLVLFRNMPCTQEADKKD